MRLRQNGNEFSCLRVAFIEFVKYVRKITSVAGNTVEFEIIVPFRIKIRLIKLFLTLLNTDVCARQLQCHMPLKSVIN